MSEKKASQPKSSESKSSKGKVYSKPDVEQRVTADELQREAKYAGVGSG